MSFYSLGFCNPKLTEKMKRNRPDIEAEDNKRKRCLLIDDSGNK